ncbi:MAG: class I SAM-dependent methyltransferase, partial [Planctomycetota bacterium]
VLSRVAGADGLVVAVDPMIWSSKPAHFFEWIDGIMHPRSYEKTFWRNVKRSGFENVWLVKELSTNDALIHNDDPRLAEFDFAFIDGEHTYDGASADIRNWGRRVRPGGILAMHDCIRRFPGVQQAVAELQGDPRYRVELPKRGSIAVVHVLAAPTAAEVGENGNGSNGHNGSAH